MEGHAKKCVERYSEHANKTTQQSYEVATPCMDDHQFKEEEQWVGELSAVCSQIVLKCLYLARTGRPVISLSVNKLARAFTKWTKACDKRLARLISYIHHTSEYRQYCYVGNAAQQCRLGFFQDADFAGDLEESKSTSGGVPCIIGSHTFVPMGWMCKKQTSISHSSSEAEIIYLHAGLRMDGIPALTLWVLVIEIFRSVPNKIEQPKEELRGNPLQATSETRTTSSKSSTPTSFKLTLNAFHPTQCILGAGANLYVFEDNEAVIKMIIKGQSPTMRHVSRTHRVALDWLFDRINLDPQIQIRYIDSKHQIADILTKGNFTSDEWNNLLHFFNISHFSSLRCTKIFGLISCFTMAKRTQEQKEGERVVSKSRPAVMNVSSYLIATSSSAASSPIASLGMSGASGKPSSRMNLEASSFEAGSTSQVRLRDAYLGGLKEEQQGNLTHEKEPSSEETDDSESEPWFHKPVARTNEACGKPFAGETAESISSAFQKSQSNVEATLEHFSAISPQTIPYTDAVYDMIRKIYGRPSGNPMKDLDVNVATWRVFMNATLKAAIHFGNDHDVNLRNVKNYFWRSTEQLFGEIEKLISGQTETAGLSLIDSEDLRWISTSLLHSRAYQYATVKVYVFSDSVLCLGKMGPDPVESWKNLIQWYSETNYFSELNRFDGKPMEFKWKNPQ